MAGWRRHRVRLLAAAGILAAAGCMLLLLTGDPPMVTVACAGAAAVFVAGYRSAAVGTRALLAAAYTDPLTGLPTRAVADHLMAEADRAGGWLGVVVADVDNLNDINVAGHAEGDRYLATIARRLTEAVGHRGTAVRLGGDEFAVFSTDLSADQLRTAVRACLADPTVVAGISVRPRVSVGVAARITGRAGYALACADAAMRTVKAAGGDNIAVYRPDRDGVPPREGLRPQLRRRDHPPGRQPLAGPVDRLLRLYLTAAEAHGVHYALQNLHDRWAQASRAGGADVRPPGMAGTASPGLASVHAAAWQASIGRLCQVEADRYGRLAQRVLQIIDRANALP
ncbi:GGDEF domain-containing protein [Phytohabitans houttuyneae]|uniref:GGDEF domain-containing protein n=1 Tax=Phytohabitans houttuyneae TaxID=1076126 RepID=UPI001565E413|nr:GGDEF domain-containing protein [Phytohabitans houttuyneae]